MRTLVTGGSGFLGSHLVELLEASGHDVTAPRSAEFDLTRADDAERLFAELRPELVFHVAALAGGINANRLAPGRFWYANLLMGAFVLEQSRLHGVEKLVMLGTICEYPKFAPVPFREDDLWDGFPEETNAPYGIAKKTHLVGGQAYRDQYGLDVIHLLPVNLYGPRDNFDLETSHVIPALIRKFCDAKQSGTAEVLAWGTGSATREFLYVEDAAEAIVFAAEKYAKPDLVNLGSGKEITVRDLVEQIRQLVGYSGAVRWDASKPDGQPRRCLDTSRAVAKFGWRAKTNLHDGLQSTINWYTEHFLSQRTLSA